MLDQIFNIADRHFSAATFEDFTHSQTVFYGFDTTSEGRMKQFAQFLELHHLMAQILQFPSKIKQGNYDISLKKDSKEVKHNSQYVYIYKKYCLNCGTRVLREVPFEAFTLEEPLLVYCRECFKLIEPYKFQRFMAPLLLDEYMKTCEKNLNNIMMKLDTLKESFEKLYPKPFDLWDYLGDCDHVWYHVLDSLWWLYYA